MKKSLFIAACLFSSLAVAQADTIDLLSDIETGSGTAFGSGVNISKSVSAVTADYVTTWLDGQSVGMYDSLGNGNTPGTNPITPEFSSSDEGYTLSFYNRTGLQGSVVGFATSLGETDLSEVTNLTFSYTGITTGGSANTESGALVLVYQVNDVWESTVATFSSNDTSATVSVDLTDVLSSSTVYAVVVTTTGTGSRESGTISLTATTSASVPEPATASLSLLGLGALLLRRRRR